MRLEVPQYEKSHMGGAGSLVRDFRFSIYGGKLQYCTVSKERRLNKAPVVFYCLLSLRLISCICVRTRLENVSDEIIAGLCLFSLNHHDRHRGQRAWTQFKMEHCAPRLSALLRLVLIIPIESNLSHKHFQSLQNFPRISRVKCVFLPIFFNRPYVLSNSLCLVEWLKPT